MIQRIIKKINRTLAYSQGKRNAKKLGITFQEPTYIYKTPLNENSIVVDVGCCSDPDLSIFFMEAFDSFAYGVDPTRKHFKELKGISGKYEKFKHLPFAIAEKDQQMTFFESKDSDSGSLLNNHINVQKDRIESYEVEAITVNTLLKKINAERVDFLKLDLEGAEFALLEKTQANDFESVDQLYIEFHHHAIPEKTFADTEKLVKKIEGFGFSSFTLEDANYLFFRD